MGAPRPLDSDIYQCRKKTQVTGNRKQVNLRHSHYPSNLRRNKTFKIENSSHYVYLRDCDVSKTLMALC